MNRDRLAAVAHEVAIATADPSVRTASGRCCSTRRQSPTQFDDHRRSSWRLGRGRAACRVTRRRRRAATASTRTGHRWPAEVVVHRRADASRHRRAVRRSATSRCVGRAGRRGHRGSIVRWLVLRSPAGVLTADEAYTGIQSFEILGGQFPVVLGGTAYTLPFEAYLYAPIAAVFGANVVVLKLLSARCRGRRFGRRRARRAPARSAVGRASIAAAMCWVTPGALLLISVTAYSAYASGLAVTSARSWPPACRRSTRRPEPLAHGRVRRARRIRVLAAPDVPRHARADGARGAVGAPAPARCLGAGDRRRHPRLSPASGVEREELLAVAGHAGRRRGHVRRTPPHVRRRTSSRVRSGSATCSSSGSRTPSSARCSTWR